MDEDEEQTKKSGWGELGHKWITAIAALITALAAAGFFIGRESASDSKESAPRTSPPTTVIVEREAATTAASTPTQQAPDQPKPFWTGDLTWSSTGGFNFDIAPPIHTSGRYVYAGMGGVLESYGDAASITVWKSNAQPGKNECASAVDDGGRTYISGVVKGNYVCGRTYEGRVFRLAVVGAGNGLRCQAIVWER